MKLVKMVVAGFRGFADEVDFDMDADVILLSGPNGAGKTSFFDAILWGLTGAVSRVGSNESIVNRFSQFGEARVEIHLADADGTTLEVVRRFGASESLSVAADGDRRNGTAGQALILERLWPDGQGSSDPAESFSQSLTKSVYLEQDRVSGFVEADNEQTRFEVVGEIIGAGRLGELNRQLAAGRRAWTTATNRLDEDFQPTIGQVDQIERRLADISGIDELRVIDADWQQWVAEVSDFVESIDSQVPSDRRAAELDSALSAVQHLQRSVDAESLAVDRLLELVADPPPLAESMERDAERARTLTVDLGNATVELQRAEDAASAARRDRLAEADSRQSLGALAQLALRHLDEICPVCAQVHNRTATEARLERLVDEANLAPEIAEDSVLTEAADHVRELEAELAEVQALVRNGELMSRRRQDWESRLSSIAADAGLVGNPVPPVEALEFEASSRRSRAEKLRELRAAGETLAVSFARLAEAAEAAGLRAQLASLKKAVDEHEAELGRRRQTAEDAQELHEAIRSISESIVVQELKRIEPCLQRIYSTVDPHPAFRAVKFLTRMHHGRGRLWIPVEATVGGETITIDEPKTVLSSSQLNVLAVSVFLALNLSVSSPALMTIALDDPLQSLDNVNLLGLSDLLRRLRGQRQIILSTHDDRLATLLERKLRPVEDAERTIAISLRGWDRSGPQVRVRDVTRDDGRLRLVSA
ncbi:MAG: AAA family ATPase [Acidimicrobiaceae bacterium]|nr:AAA family ATPase [Acidimicrobiaceae bacterium]MDE0497122.1 AAA family ATPase [Acidimicrobiaceae bacterium]